MLEETKEMTNRLAILTRTKLFPLCLLGIVVLAGCNTTSLRSLSIWKSGEDGVASIEETISDSNFVPLAIWHDSFEAAQGIAVENGKPILAGFTGSDWCRPCKRLKNDVLDTDEFMDWAGRHVVLLELDYPKATKQAAEQKEQNEALKKRYQISKYPTLLLLGQDGEVLGELETAQATPGLLIERAEVILAN